MLDLLTDFTFRTVAIGAALLGMVSGGLGAFAVLRRQSLLGDAVSHAALPGIAIAFLLTGTKVSALLMLGALVAGWLGTICVMGITRTTRISYDSALGPRALWVMSAILIINFAFILLFFKELKLATFDAGLAATLGFAPAVLHYSLMGLVSVTAVGAFDAVGSILVVALMIGPPAAAYLLTDRLGTMIGLSMGLGILSAIGGYWLAHAMDTSIAGAMAAMVGIVFFTVFLLAPQRGMVALAVRRSRQRWQFAARMLTIHLLHHEGTPEEPQECSIDHLQDHLEWGPAFAERAVRYSKQQAFVQQRNGLLLLTPKGREIAQEALTEF